MSKALRVGFLAFRDLSRAGGTSIRLHGIANHLVDYDCNVVLINSYPPSSELRSEVGSVVLKRSATPRGLPSLLHMAYPRLLFWLRYMPDVNQIVKQVKSLQLDILHVHKHGPGYAAFRVRDALDIPILFDAHGIMHLQREDLALLGMSDRRIHLHLRAERMLFKHADAVSVVSNRMGDYVIDRFGLAPDKVHVIPDAVEPDFFARQVDEKEKEKLRAQNNLGGKKVILFAGAFKKLGGIMDLLEAYCHLLKDPNMEDVALIMIGDGQLLPDVRQFKEENELNNLILPGRVQRFELLKYQAIADVLVVPEGLSRYNDMVPHIKLFECLASGKPTVATRLATISDVIKDGQNGILVEPGQPKALARGLARVLSDETLQQSLGYYGRRAIGREQTWAYSAQAAIQAYQYVLSRRGKRAV